MRKTISLARLLLAGMALVTGDAAFAQSPPTPLKMPGDPKLVVFPYDRNTSYTILTRPRAVTNIELLPGETVRFFALGDTVAWQTVEDNNQVFIKPIYPNQQVSGTLVTNQRVYQLTLESGDEKAQFYQRVSFQYPELIAADNRKADLLRLAATELPAKPKVERAEDAASAPDISRLNFAYDFEGKASFKPAQVYDDGRNTYVRFGPEVIDMPALFRLREGKAVELVEYTSKGNILIVPRVLEAGLLKLGDNEVRFRNLSRFTKTWTGKYELSEK